MTSGVSLTEYTEIDVMLLPLSCCPDVSSCMTCLVLDDLGVAKSRHDG